METLTGPHAVVAQLGEQLGCVLGNDQVPAVGGAHDQRGIRGSRWRLALLMGCSLNTSTGCRGRRSALRARKASFGRSFAGIRDWGLHKRGADELRRCQEIAAVDPLDRVERVGGEDDDLQIRVGPGDLRVDANG